MQSEIQPVIAAIKAGAARVRCDSRLIQDGDIFVALAGNKAKGASFIGDAAVSGARWIICSREDEAAARSTAPQCMVVAVDDPQAALGELGKASWHPDHSNLKITGITGTNGKTTCAWLMEYILNAQGIQTGLLGTVEYHWPGHREPASLTTPDTLSLHEMLGQMEKCGVQAAVMEVSSHALAQNRIAGIEFDGAIFTNLTQDHLDYHADMEDYFQAKARLFCDLPRRDKVSAINADDPFGRRLLAMNIRAIPYGLNATGEGCLRGEIISLSPEGMHLQMRYGNSGWELRTHLVGAFNASNLLAVQALGIAYGFAPDTFQCLRDFPGVPGRLERIINPQGLNIFVDYAHTPDALVNALSALRGAGFRRIITLFGCGGDRDRTKRPLMGQAVAKYSDIAFLTSDNPRTEDPQAIMDDVRPGLDSARQAYFEADRKEATRLAIGLMQRGDALLIAGKGHEDYQIIGTHKRHYSDQEAVKELLACK